MRSVTLVVLTLLALLLVSAPAGAQPAFTRGVWTQYGTGTFSAAQWHVREAGAGGAFPYDALLTSAGTFTTFTAPQARQRLGEVRGQPGGVQAPFVTWDTSVWDSVRKRLIVTLWGGHQAESSNEVNEWDFATGTWNPDGRPFHPTTRLHVTNATSWPATYNADPSKPDAPPAVIDVNNNYTAGIKLSTGSGRRLVPLGRHTYDGMTFMPSVQKLWAWGGVGDWQVSGGPYIMAEWDTVAKQWQLIDGPDGNVFGGGTFTGSASGTSTWDSVANRVLFTNDAGLWAYNPSGTINARTTRLLSDRALVNSLGNAHMVFDPKKNRAYILGAPTSTTFIQLDFSGGHTTSPVKTFFTPTGSTWPTTSGSSGVGFGPGGFYDPVADRVIIWTGGKTLYSMDSSYVTTTIGGTGASDPGTPPCGIWHRIDYVPGADVYVTINDATVPGAFIFAPIRPPA